VASECHLSSFLRCLPIQVECEAYNEGKGDARYGIQLRVMTEASSCAKRVEQLL
jgi:hypothetical protein